MIERLVEKSKTELPVLFDPIPKVLVAREDLRAMLQAINTAQATGDINEQIRSLQRVQKILDRLLK